ncbi:hypothetical protein C0431_15365 [bacterium]|nr:hypothetical protein [bacterium]
MATKNPTPLLYQLREGSVSDPFVDKIENVKLVAGRAILDEIPVKQFGIIVDGHQETGTNNPTGVQFYVDYTNGVLYFESTKTGSVTIRYKGRGVVQIPSDRIFHTSESTDQTLNVTIENIMEITSDARQTADSAAASIGNATTQANHAKTQGDYAKTQGDYAKSEGAKIAPVITNANTATTNANSATSAANTATTGANTARDNANAAATNANAARDGANTARDNANTAATNATTQANYAKTQGDHAKTQGDYAKTQGDRISTITNSNFPAATQSIAGLMSSSDKTALDGAQKWRLTENGGGSKSIATNDADNEKDAGFFGTFSNTLNVPEIGGHLQVIRREVTQSVQIFYGLASKNVYVRFWSQHWTPWKKLTDDNSLANVVMGNKIVNQAIANFIGKVRASTTASPHLAYFGAVNALINPSSYTAANEYSQVAYDALASQGSANATGSNSINGNIMQSVFSFNLIEHVQRTYGTIPGSTTADKVLWLRANIGRLVFNWWGFGSSPTGNKATIRAWNGSQWLFNTEGTTSAPARYANAISGVNVGSYIDNNGFFHFLAFSEPSDGVTPSTINTDYVELNVELSTDIKTNLLLGGVQGYKLTADDGRSKVTNVSNLDTLFDSGEYYTGAGCVGVPEEGYFRVSVQNIEGNVRYQTVTKVSSSETFVRSYAAGLWRKWKRLNDRDSLISTLMGNSITDQSNANFIGKVAGSTTANPHIGGRRTSVGLGDPTNNGLWVEHSDSGSNAYSRIHQADGALSSTITTLLSGTQAQEKFSFNLIEHVQRTYGTIPGATTADKVAWLRVNISRLTFNWWGSGSSPAGNKASFALWDVAGVWNATVSHANASVQRLSIASTQTSLRIDSNGFVHALAYADPSDGTTASVINTDYVELIVDLDTSLKKNLAPTWIDAVLQNGWVEFDSGRKPRYSQGVDGYVFLRGAVRLGTLGSSTPIMTLPTGFRPLNSFAFSAIAGISTNMLATIQVNAAGQVSVISQGSTDNAYVSLDNVCFPTN